MLVRPATAADAPALARIYNQGIEDRTATFETTLRSEYDILGWFDGVHPIVVVLDEPSHDVIAFARATEYRARECYRGIFEFAVYTDRAQRRRGAGQLAMRELITRAREAGAWKLVSRLFVENEGSRGLMLAVGFREVGTYYRHAKLDGQWRDVVIVEKFLAPIGAIPSVPPPPGAVARGSRGDVLASLRDEKADASALAQALDWARAIVDSFKRPDPDLLEAVTDGFFLTHSHPTALRTQFVEVFRAYAALSADASRDVYALLFSRLGRIPIASDLEAFYNALFVVKQIARGADDAIHPHVDTILELMRAAVDVPAGLRGRISAGNVISLLMTLAASANPTQEQRHGIAEIAVIAKLRHRVDLPAALKGPPSLPAPITPRRSAPPPLPQRASQPDPQEIVDDDVIPLSSQDLLPDLETMATPAVAFKPMPLPPQAEPPKPEPPKPEEPKIEAPKIEEPKIEAPVEEAKPKSKRRTKKEIDPNAPPKKRASRAKKRPPPTE